MPTISGAEIDSVIALFNERGVKFYHACQYKDFKTYLDLGGIPSRNVMEQSNLPYTPFDTDNVDKNNYVWKMVFGNLQDFGVAFAQGQRNENTAPTPNPYGPILLILNPEVLMEAADIAICLRSAGGMNFQRDNEALPDAETVNRIFEYENLDDAPNQYAKSYIAFSGTLRERFNNINAMTPEISCAVENEILSFNQLIRIIIDPYVINNQGLVAKVGSLKNQYGLNGVVWERLYRQGENRFAMKQDLANLLLHGFVDIQQVIQNEGNSEDLRDWARRIHRGNMTFFYNRFVRYLRTGTILELNGEGDQ